MNYKIKNMIFLIEVIFSVSICGCTGGWWESHAHFDLYKELNSNKILTLSVFPVKINRSDSNEIRELNEYFMTGISKILKNYVLINQYESMERLNRDSLSEKYHQLSGINTSGMKMGKLMKEAGISIGCDAVVLPEINVSGRFITVIYTIYSTKDVKLLFINSVETDIYLDKTTRHASLIELIKADINRLLKNTYR